MAKTWQAEQELSYKRLVRTMYYGSYHCGSDVSIMQNICDNAYRHMRWIREEMKRMGR